jgi:hypothetical protein
MGTEVELNVGIAKFRIDLSEFAEAMKRLIAAAIGANEKDHACDAMKMLLIESGKTFQTIVQTLAPLYVLTSEAAFAAQFTAKHEEFKTLYMERKMLARTHCDIVRTQFYMLQQRQSWMAHLPVAQKAYADLESLCNRWLFQDWRIVEDLESFLGNLNTLMQQIGGLHRADPEQAYQMLMLGLKPIEDDFFSMQTRLGELEALGRQL